MFSVLLACLCLAAATPIPQLNGITQGSYIRSYGPAWYDTSSLREHHGGRWRRDAVDKDSESPGTPERPLVLRLEALGRVFKMRLVRDVGLFASDAEFEGSKGRLIAYNTQHAYTGTLEDDKTALVHGVVTSDGLFDGTVRSANGEEIYIEPASRYFRKRRSESPSLDDVDVNDEDDVSPIYHTIAYRSNDVATPRQEHSCDSELLHRNGSLNFNHTFRKSEATYQPNTSQPIYQHLNDGKSHAKPGFYPKDARRKQPTASSHNLELLDKLYRERYTRVLRKRTSVDPKKTTCMLYLQADHTFFAHYKSEEACIEVMTRHVQRVNAIYRYTDFNQDGQPDNISFMIKRVKVHGHDALQDPTYRFTGTYGVEEFLELFSEEDYDAFCLSYMFTYRDFEKGTLGLAWTGDLKNAGGVCEKNGHYRGSMKSLNTGIITLLNYGKHVPPAVSHVTLAHEIGHNFGSPHDPDECSPGGEDGNFIMFARATSGDKRNNNRFSPCSLLSINPVLNNKARSAKGCFAEPQSSLCGNGVVEEGEECDCGWEEDCNDPCCHPQRRHHPAHEIPCRLTEGSVCSPSQGPCCTSGCTLRNGDKCRDDNGCRDASFCDGYGPQCPQSINKPNKTICNEEFVCYMGECTGSICLAYGLESCQCIAAPDDPPTKSCELCCKIPGENQPCLSSFAWNLPPYDIPDMFSKPGTPCNDYNGYCDIFQKCREVDPSGPLATLRRLLLSDASLATFQRWITDHWYGVAILALVVLIALITVAQFFGRRASKLSGLQSGGTAESGENDCYVKEIGGKRQQQTAPKISPMSVTRIKKRIIETMKTITSPSRNKTCPNKSELRISKLFNFGGKNESGEDSQSENKPRTKNQNTLSKPFEAVAEIRRDGAINGRTDGAVFSTREKSKLQGFGGEEAADYSKIPSTEDGVSAEIADQSTRGSSDRKKRKKMTDASSGSDWEKRGFGNWFLRGIGFGDAALFGDESSPKRRRRRARISVKSSWTNVASNFRNIDALRGSPKQRKAADAASPQNRFRANNQSTEPLVEPDTPETPESPVPEVAASRVATSDLAVLLKESS